MNIMRNAMRFTVGFFLLIGVLSFPALAQTSSAMSIPGDFTFSFGQSVIGPDGTMYTTTSYFTFTWGTIFGSPSSTPKDSELNAYVLNPSTKSKDGQIKFPGYASKLAIGASNLYLIVTPSGSSFTTSPKATLYIINALVPLLAPGVNIDSIANIPVSTDAGTFTPVIKVPLTSGLPSGKALTAGYVTDLELKTVGGKEYVYVKTATYSSSFTATTQLTIYNSDGSIARDPVTIH
jgi:hypothetical protein